MRQFISFAEPDKDGILEITGKDFKYLHSVLRLKSGDMLSVRLPDGSLQNTTVCRLNAEKRVMTLQICADTQNKSVTRGVQAAFVQSETACNAVEFWLLQYIAKPVKMEQIIRQATECGVAKIIPIAGEYSQKQNVLAMSGAKKERVERIVREARQQSGSAVETDVCGPCSTKEALSLWKTACMAGYDGSKRDSFVTAANATSSADGENAQNFKIGENVALVLWERNERTRRLTDVLSKNVRRVAIAVGCEGGISPAEIEQLEKDGFAPIHFAGNILRCETAALYGIAAVQSMLGEMGDL